MIIYATVAKANHILAEYTTFDGDFADIAKTLIEKSPKSN
jgi:hypothetical protein